jgi:cytoskeleton protein RodZ
MAEDPARGSSERDAEDTEDRGAAARGPGAMLREAREARGLTVRDLAETLNLAVSTVRALEADDYERLPRPAFVRGYLRSYARLLTLDPQPLLEAHETLVGRFDPQLEVAEVVRTRPPALTALVHERPGLVMTVASAAGLLLLVVLLLAVWPEEGAPAARQAERAPGPTAAPAPAPAAPGSGTEGAAVDAAPARLAEAESASLVPVGGGPEPVAAEASTPDAEPAPAPAVATAAAPAAVAADAAVPGPSITREVDADGRGIRIYAGGEDHLRLVFAADCWVQVRDAGDVDVYGDLNRSGETLDLWGRAPFRVRLGYAPGVELRYNDRAVPLRPHTRGDIASLVIGR